MGGAWNTNRRAAGSIFYIQPHTRAKRVILIYSSNAVPKSHAVIHEQRASYDRTPLTDLICLI